MGTAQENKNNCSGCGKQPWCGSLWFESTLRCLLLKPSSIGTSQLWESQEVQFPSCQSSNDLPWEQHCSGSVQGRNFLGRETDLWQSKGPSEDENSYPSWQDLGPKAPRLVHTLTCQGQGWIMEKCLLTDLVSPSLSRITVSKNSQPVTYLCIYHF